jgi:hypothetical protein
MCNCSIVVQYDVCVECQYGFMNVACCLALLQYLFKEPLEKPMLNYCIQSFYYSDYPHGSSVVRTSTGGYHALLQQPIMTVTPYYHPKRRGTKSIPVEILLPTPTVHPSYIQPVIILSNRG